MVRRNQKLDGSVTDFFKDLGSSVIGDKEVKTNAIVIAVKAVTGTEPVVDRKNPQQNMIRFTNAQKAYLEAMVNKSAKAVINKKTGTSAPANVKVDFEGLIRPIIIKKVLPVVIGIGLIGFMVGRFTKK